MRPGASVGDRDRAPRHPGCVVCEIAVLNSGGTTVTDHNAAAVVGSCVIRESAAGDCDRAAIVADATARTGRVVRRGCSR